MKQFALSILYIAFIVVLSSALSREALAGEKLAGNSATFAQLQSVPIEDARVTKLRSYLESRNSPLSVHAEDFVREADQNRLDWKFVAAVSGAESSFGLRIPPNSYNGWGWGVYGNKVTRFSSWSEGISIISVSIREKYMNKWGARNIREIGRIYAASPTWSQKVQYFMNQIENHQEKDSLAVLPITI